MIQRIQTLWLILAAFAALLTLKFSFFSGNKIGADLAKKWVELTATNNFIILVLTVAIAVISIIVIILYKDRKMQFRLTVLSFLLSIANIILYYSESKKFTEGNMDFTAVISMVVPVFLFLAARGIYKDDKLIKSADRLR
jgi:hypothetical protein